MTTPENARETYAKAHANTSGPHHQGQTSTEVQAALDEIDDLRRWKAEAMEVLKWWDSTFEALPFDRRRAALGATKAAAVRRWIINVQDVAAGKALR